MQHSAEKLVTLLNDEEWELLVRDWAEGLRTEYHTVDRIGGAGDQGRDVVCYTADPKSCPPWDNFQCKRYGHPLMPSEIWLELGKLCWFTFKGEFTIPRRYQFVSPKDVGTSLFKAFEKPEMLREGLVENWVEHCSKDITAKQAVVLDGDFKAWVEAFDFSIVGYLPVRKFLKQLEGTAAYITRFGGGLPQRPPDQLPPAAIAPIEAKYVRRLLDAYADCLACTIADVDALTSPVHRQHFDRSREHFYRAESLRVFSRPVVPDGTFEALQKEIYDGVVDVCESEHHNGFECVKSTTQAARSLQLTSNALITVLNLADRNGICHQLASVDKLIWVKR